MEMHNKLMKQKSDLIQSVVAQKTVGAKLSKAENVED